MIVHANLKKQARKAVPKEAKRYAHELFEEINEDRESRGKKPFEEDGQKPDREPQMVEKTVSTADPDSGIFHKGEHKKVFAYETHTACDKHNFVLGVHVTPGNVHDSVAFEPLYNDLCAHYPEHKIVAAETVPTRPRGSAKEFLKAAVYFPPPIFAPKQKTETIRGMSMFTMNITTM